MRSPLAGLAPARRRQAVAVLGVVGLLVVALVVWGSVRALSGSASADQATPGPVVLVPGYGGSTADLAPLVDRLRREGRVAVVYDPTDHNTGDLRVQARRLAALVTATLRSSGARSVDLVGYSAGGVIARLYVRDDGGASVVRRVLTLGSPQHGTDVADLAVDVAGCPTACEQLATGSELLRQLNAGDETPAGPRWVTVRTDSDTTVTPTTSAELAGALNIEVQAVCPGSSTTHGGLPSDPVVLATLASALGPGAPRVPTGVAC